MSEISRTRAPVVVKAVVIRLAGIAQFLMVIASCSVCRSSSTTYGRLTRTVSPPADCQSHPYGLLETMAVPLRTPMIHQLVAQKIDLLLPEQSM